MISAAARNRTENLAIKSRLLCQLSYGCESFTPRSHPEASDTGSNEATTALSDLPVNPESTHTTRAMTKESNLQPNVSNEGLAAIPRGNFPLADSSRNPENRRTATEPRTASDNKTTTGHLNKRRLSSLSRLQVGTGYTLPQSEKCGLCDEPAVTEIAGVALCVGHDRRAAEIAAENAGTSGRKPATWAITYAVAS